MGRREKGQSLRPREEDKLASVLLCRTACSKVADHVRGELVNLQEDVCATCDGLQSGAKSTGACVGVGVGRFVLPSKAGVQTLNHRGGEPVRIHQQSHSVTITVRKVKQNHVLAVNIVHFGSPGQMRQVLLLCRVGNNIEDGAGLDPLGVECAMRSPQKSAMMRQLKSGHVANKLVPEGDRHAVGRRTMRVLP